MKFLWVCFLSMGLLQCQTIQRSDKVSNKSWKLPWKKSKPSGYQVIKKSDFFEPLQNNEELSGKINDPISGLSLDDEAKNFLDRQLQNHTSRLSSSDIENLEKYRRPAAGSASEAALVVGLLKATHHQQTVAKSESKNTFQESDTLDDSFKTNLGELSGLYEVDPIGALKQNHYLQSGKITELALLATQKTKNSVVYDRQISVSMNKRIDRWNRIHKKYQAKSNIQVEPDVTEERETSSTIDILEKLKPLKPRQVRSKPTKKPIEEVETFSDDNAGLKIVDESAVETLRQKAAAAYQSSLPIRSPKAKLRHLTKAKKYLQYAMNRYKGNNQNEKLLNNLEVVEEAIQATKEKATNNRAQ